MILVRLIPHIFLYFLIEIYALNYRRNKLPMFVAEKFTSVFHLNVCFEEKLFSFKEAALLTLATYQNVKCLKKNILHIEVALLSLWH